MVSVYTGSNLEFYLYSNSSIIMHARRSRKQGVWTCELNYEKNDAINQSFLIEMH